VEADGYVSMEAGHYTRKTDAGAGHWEKIDDYGRTSSSMTILPCNAASATPPSGTSSLEYRMYLFDPGTVEVHTIIAPTLNFVPGRGLRFAVAFDDQPPRIVDALAHNSLHDWEESVKDSVRDIKSTHTLAGTGYHVLKYWMVDPGVVLQKIVVDLGGLKPSYLGPPESYRKGTL
jgi:Gylcosyl hydrolase family 115 C-terminal domain